jgi:UDP-glucose 6-dehydrogenase
VELLSWKFSWKNDCDLGAAFKQHTSSTSFSPIHPMLAALWAQGVTVRLHDPQALEEIHKFMVNVII